jgi:hypothetical protein
MKKIIIAVAALAVALAVGIVAWRIVVWRMGATQQEQVQEQVITLVTQDKKQTPIEKNRALLFGTVRDLQKDMSKESQKASGFEMPVRIQTQAALQAVIDDLPWVMQVREQMRSNETEQQAAERIVKAMAAVPLNENDLQKLISKLNVATYLYEPALIEWYARQIADILVSDDSMKRLANNDTTIIQQVKAGLPETALDRCSHYIFKEHWIDAMTLRHARGVKSALFSPDAKKVVTASDDKMAKIWNVQTGALEHALDGHTGWVNSASFSPDGSKIVTASIDKTAKIWNAQTGALEHTLAGHTGGVLAAEFSLDGSKIVTASMDATAKIWNAVTGKLEHTLTGHTEFVNSASFSPDGSKIVTGSTDNTSKIFACLPKSLPGISTFEACLFERLLTWAQEHKQKISKEGWVGDILRSITWREVEPVAKKEFQKLGRESIAR